MTGGIMKAKEYLELPYHIVIQHLNDESGSYYFATVRELDGCMSHGDSYEEAFRNIHEAMEGWVETKLEGGFPVPAPIEDNQYSGKFVLRLPKSLHAKLATEAEREGVSLNQYALYRLSL
jgi:predicted RNase H-like HicB family nuclease